MSEAFFFLAGGLLLVVAGIGGRDYLRRRRVLTVNNDFVFGGDSGGAIASPEIDTSLVSGFVGNLFPQNFPSINFGFGGGEKSNFEKAEPLLDLIGQKESGGNYNVAYGGRYVPLTGMTIDEVLDWQAKNNPAGAATAAAGKYQIIRTTLLELKKRMGLSGKEYFDRRMQDAMAYELLKKRGFEKFIAGQLSLNSFMVRIAQEWASFPVPQNMQGHSRYVSAGQSYYAGDGVNKAGVSVTAVLNVLDEVKRA